jgi:DNA-binding CsgD family transcriptional regulator
MMDDNDGDYGAGAATADGARAGLTPREQRVLDLANSGRTNQQIAAELGISKNAVRYHLKELHSKLETGGQREELRAPRWRRLVGSFFALALGKAGPAMSFGILGGTLALAAAGAYVAYPGSNSLAQTPGAVDGFYPNGCSERYNPSGTQNLDEFAAMLRVDPSTLRALNPRGWTWTTSHRTWRSWCRTSRTQRAARRPRRRRVRRQRRAARPRWRRARG